MKKYIILIILLFLFQCKKYTPVTKSCNCGAIVSDNYNDFSIVVSNNCSGNNMTFYLDPTEWDTTYVGNIYCNPNNLSW